VHFHYQPDIKYYSYSPTIVITERSIGALISYCAALSKGVSTLDIRYSPAIVLVISVDFRCMMNSD